MSEEMNRAAVTPCHECPWRTTNKDRPVPESYSHFYTRDQRINLWAALRFGGSSRMVCHLSAADELNPQGADPEWIAAGFEAVPAHGRLRECAGNVAVALRELRHLAEAGTWEEYRRRRPGGFTLEAATQWARRVAGDEVPPFPPLRQVAVTSGEILDPAVEDAPSALELLAVEQLSSLGAMFAAVRASLADPQATSAATS